MIQQRAAAFFDLLHAAQHVAVLLDVPFVDQFVLIELLVVVLVMAFGSPIRDGNAHDPHNVPVVVAGKASGKMRTGRHLEFPEGTPLCSLWINMLESAGVKAPKFGDAATGLRGV